MYLKLFLGISCQLQAVALYEDIESKINASEALKPAQIRENVTKAYNNAALYVDILFVFIIILL